MNRKHDGKRRSGTSWLGVAALAALLTGCALRLESPVLPNLNLKGNLPNGTDLGKLAPTVNIGDQSKRDNGKTVLATLQIPNNVASELRLSAEQNCVQLVELSSKTVVLDMAGQACPANAAQPLDDRSVVYTAAYYKIEENRYRLTYQSKDIGEFQLGSDSSVTLTHLCTGRYLYYCYQPVTNDRISAEPVTY